MVKFVQKIIAIFLILLFPVITTAAEVLYVDTDAYGTPVVITNSSGTKVWDGEYLPFGEEYKVSNNYNNRRFIGKEKDRETGLTYFGARYYDEVQGRFISVDPVGPVDAWSSSTNYGYLTQPQRLNRYAYGLNNPYRYIDPDGLTVELTGTEAERQGTIEDLSQFVQGTLSIDENGTLSRTPCGSYAEGKVEEIVDQLIASDFTYRIHRHLSDKGWGRSSTRGFPSGRGANIFYDPNTTGTYRAGFLGLDLQYHSPASELAHELLGRGSQIDNGMPGGRYGDRNRSAANRRAVDIANEAFKRMDMKPRVGY